MKMEDDNKASRPQIVDGDTKGFSSSENCAQTGGEKMENLTDNIKPEESNEDVSAAVKRSISPTNEEKMDKMKQGQPNATSVDPEKELTDEGPPPASQIPVVKNAIKIKLKWLVLANLDSTSSKERHRVKQF